MAAEVAAEVAAVVAVVVESVADTNLAAVSAVNVVSLFLLPGGFFNMWWAVWAMTFSYVLRI